MSEEFKPTLADRDPAFNAYYEKHLKPLESRYEGLRQEAVRERNRRIVAVVLAWAGGLGVLGWMAQQHGSLGDVWFFFGFFALVAGISLGVWAYLPAGAHEMRLQEQVLPLIVPYFGELSYRQEPKFDPGQFADWLILPVYSKTKSQDEISGRYHGVPLRLAEFRLQYTTRSRSSSGSSSSSEATAFKGLVIEFELEREYAGVSLARTQGSDMNGRFRLDENLQPMGTGSGFERFATEDSTGIQVMGDGFLNALHRIDKRFQAKQLFASVHANRLVLLIEHKGDYFEMSHRKTTDFARDADRIRDELEGIFSIVDQLGLKGPDLADAAPVTPHAPPSDDVDEAYDVGGWGCLQVFVMFVACMAAFLWLLDPQLHPGARLAWAFLGGSLSALGLYQFLPSKGRGLGSRIGYSAFFFAGAYAVFHYFGPG